MQKKILLISNNFAVGWAGHLTAAGSVIRSLQSSLSPDMTTLESVRQVLTKPDTSQLGSLEVSLIGWVIDTDGQHCFLWNSLYPGKLFPGVPQYDGSGDLTARALFGAKGLHHASPPDHIDPHEVSRGALSMTTLLMAYEFWDPSTKQLGFGCAYEILQLVDGTHFKYLDDALFIPIAFDLDDRGRYLGVKFCASQVKYKAQGNCSTFYIYDPIKNAQEVYTIPPPGPYPVEAESATEQLRQHVVNETFSFPFESDYYCCSFRLRSPTFETTKAFFVARKDEAKIHGVRINIEEHAIGIDVSREWVEWMFNYVRTRETEVALRDT